MEIQMILLLFLGLVAFVIGIIFIVMSWSDATWGKTWAGLLSAFSGLAVWCSAFTAFGVGQDSASLSGINSLLLEHIYVLDKDQELFQPRNEKESEYAGQYLTWLKREGKEKSKAYRFTEKLTCRKFVVFRNEKHEMEIQPRETVQRP